MIIDPNNRLFDRVPEIFNSPYPGADVFADTAFKSLLQRTSGDAKQSVGEAILSQAGAQAWNQATQMLWKTKATLSGDLLAGVWSKVAWANPKTDAVAGLLAEVPFAVTADPAQLLGAMANVAVDLALNAVSAVPVAGWIIGIVVGIGRALASLFKGIIHDGAASPTERASLPWGRYNRDIDQEWVRTFINIDATGVDWTPMFAPPTAGNSTSASCTPLTPSKSSVDGLWRPRGWTRNKPACGASVRCRPCCSRSWVRRSCLRRPSSRQHERRHRNRGERP